MSGCTYLSACCERFYNKMARSEFRWEADHDWDRHRCSTLAFYKKIPCKYNEKRIEGQWESSARDCTADTSRVQWGGSVKSITERS